MAIAARWCVLQNAIAGSVAFWTASCPGDICGTCSTTVPVRTGGYPVGKSSKAESQSHYRLQYLERCCRCIIDHVMLTVQPPCSTQRLRHTGADRAVGRLTTLYSCPFLSPQPGSAGYGAHVVTAARAQDHPAEGVVL